jgi:predicted dehydrogenase
MKSNRREFLKKGMWAAASAVVLPNIIPSSALGMGNSVAPNSRLTMGIIGAGGMGNANMGHFLNDKRIQITSVCDVDERNAKRAIDRINKKYGSSGVNGYGDFREMLNNEKLDTTMMALPDHWHSIIAVSVAKKGIHIYGEKPLARSVYEGKKIVEAVKKNNVTWQTGSWQRSVGHFHKAVSLVRNGLIGKVNYVEVGLPDGNATIGTPPIKNVPKGVDWDMWLGPAPKVPFRGILHFHWRWIMDYSGGQLTDWAGHHIDIAHWGLNMENQGPKTIEGKGVYPVDGIYDVPVEYDFMCEYDNGVRLRVANQQTYHESRQGKEWGGRQGNRLGMGAVWYGENGWIQVNRHGIWASNPELLKTPIESLDTKIYHSTDHWKNFVDCIQDNKKTIAPAEVAHRSVSVALLGEIAMLTGQKINWDYQKEEIVGNEMASRLLMRPMRNPWAIPTI